MEGANGTLAQLRSVAKEVTSTGNRWRFIERATATEMRAGSASTGEYFELFAIRFASASLPTPLAERFPLAPWRFLWRILRRKYLRPAMPKAESFISQMVKNVRRPGHNELAGCGDPSRTAGFRQFKSWRSARETMRLTILSAARSLACAIKL